MSMWRTRLEGAVFLDLFAGSGAVGLEALSGGAAQATFVDDELRVLAVLEANLAALSVSNARVVRSSLPADLDAISRQATDRFDLVFADPPYGFPDYGDLLAGLRSILAADSLVAIEHESERDLGVAPESGLEAYDRRVYGDSALSFYRLSSA